MQCRHSMPRFDCPPTRATWGARCGKPARRVLRGGTGTSDLVARPVPTHYKLQHSWLVRFVEHRIGDRRVVRLIQKWLKAGVMEEGQWHKTEEGSPQGAVISPILANLYLHHALDLWVDAWRKKRARGDVIIVRYADDAVLGFERREDAEQFLEQLRERLAKFGLELHPEKTRLIEFGRFAAERRKRRGEGKPETFHFLTSVGRTTRRANSRSTGKRSANAWQPSSKIFERNCASGCTSACRKPGSGCSKWCVGISNIMPFREILRGCERFAVTCYGAGYRRYGAEARTIA